MLDHSKGEITVGLQYTTGIDITKLTAILTLSDKASITSTFDPSKKGADYHKTYQTPKEVIISAEDGKTTATYKIKVQISVLDENIFGVVYDEIKRMGGTKDKVFTGDLNHLDMSAVSNMKDLFSGVSYDSFTDDDGVIIEKNRNPNIDLAKKFNGDISSWTVGNVEDMSFMFRNASSFNQSLNDWTVNKVTNIESMFQHAGNFNQPLNNWKVDKITNMSYMFYSASNFNQSLNNWTVSKVTNMGYMFYDASNFNQDLRGWETDKVTNCSSFSRYSGLQNSSKPTAGACSF